MAAPASIDIKNMQGKWTMNKEQSDPVDPVLALQGVGWLTRKAICAATLTQHMSQTPTTGENNEPTTLIKIEQFLTGGLKGSVESRSLDWTFREHSDWVFGTVSARNRYSTLQKLQKGDNEGVTDEDIKFASEGWSKETEEGEIVEAFADNVGNKWIAWQIWGFAEIDGVRKSVRKVVVKKKGTDEVARVKLVYDYLGALE